MSEDTIARTHSERNEEQKRVLSRVDGQCEPIDSPTAATNETTPAPASEQTWTAKHYSPSPLSSLGLSMGGVGVGTIEKDEHAEFIVRACNAHADLLDALRSFCGDHEATGMECAGLNAAYLHAKAVILKAQGR